MIGRFGQHRRLGVDADGPHHVCCQRQDQLTGATAQVEQSLRAVEVEPGDQVSEEHIRIARPVSRVVPSSSGEKRAAVTAPDPAMSLPDADQTVLGVDVDSAAICVHSVSEHEEQIIPMGREFRSPC